MTEPRIFLTHQTACQYWIHRDAIASKRTNCVPGATDVPSKMLVQDATRLVIEHQGLVHAAVVSQLEQRTIKGAAVHVRKMPYPKGSFYRVARGVYVASPELCFLQAASVLDMPTLILYGFELCGSYARTWKGGDAYYNRDPLTSVDAIKEYLEKSAGVAGVKRAMRVSAYIIDGSASPRESLLVVILTLPPRLGGYGLSRPHLNYPIEVDLPDRHDPSKNLVLHGDIVWPEARLIVEYDGAQHGLEDNHSRDKQRDHLLLDAGYETIRFTKERLSRPEELQRLAVTVNQRAHLRRKASSLENDSRKLELQHKLITACDPPWLQSEIA